MTKPRITIRAVDKGDLPRILEIEAASFTVDPYPESLFLQLLHRCGDLFITASLKRDAAAYMVTDARGGRAEIVSIAVDTRYRRLGIGTAMMRHTLALLRSRGMTRVTLIVRRADSGAIRFYEKFGFRRSRIARAYYLDSADGLRMTLTL